MDFAVDYIIIPLIKIGALLCLQHMFNIQIHITPFENDFRRHPIFFSFSKLFVTYFKMNTPVTHIQFDHVAVFHQSQMSTDCGFW